MNILISGGSRGIGRACVEKFSSEGHRVLFLYCKNKDAAEKTAKATGALCLQCDITDSESVKSAVQKAVELLGNIDVLVNNAGIADARFFDTIDDAAWHKMLDTNLSGAFYLCREVSRHMIRAHRGKIINIGSMWGKVGASMEVHYSAAKAGLRGMTMALAKELGPSGICVNCIEPGVIDTDMNTHLTDTDITALCDETPLGRVGKPHEVASLVYFLSSGEADFITGQCIGIDGGFAI